MLRPKQINLQVNKKLRLENESDQNRQSNNEVPRFFNLGLINRNSKTIRTLVEHNPAELTLVKSTRKDTMSPTLAFNGLKYWVGVTTKIPNGVDVLLHRSAWHPIFSYWVG